MTNLGLSGLQSYVEKLSTKTESFGLYADKSNDASLERKSSFKEDSKVD